MQRNSDYITYILQAFQGATSESIIDKCLRLLEKSKIPWSDLDDSCIINRLLLIKSGQMSLNSSTTLSLMGILPRYGNGEWATYGDVFNMLGIRRLDLSLCKVTEYNRIISNGDDRWDDFIAMLKKANIVSLVLPLPYKNLSPCGPYDIYGKNVVSRIKDTVLSSQHLMSPQQFKVHGTLTKTVARFFGKKYTSNSEEIKALPNDIQDLIEENRNVETEFNTSKYVSFY